MAPKYDRQRNSERLEARGRGGAPRRLGPGRRISVRVCDGGEPYLFLGQPFPDGVVLATGTGIVPAMEFILLAGDVVRITVDGVGELTNPVVDDAALDWLVAAIDQPLSREKPSRKKEQ